MKPSILPAQASAGVFGAAAFGRAAESLRLAQANARSLAAKLTAPTISRASDWLWRWRLSIAFPLLMLVAGMAAAHGVDGKDKAFLLQSSGPQPLVFVYLGAKHMVTGYDHLLFLFGVIFFLYRMREVAGYVTLFALGHSVTLLYGVLGGVHVNAYLMDAIIGLSVVYKALDNLGAFKTWFGVQPNTKAAVLVFGFFHGFGLATKLQAFELSPNGLVTNILAFNVGVELGQLLALGGILIAMGFWRRTNAFQRQAFTANALLMTAGFVLIGYQLAGYYIS